MPKEIFIGDPNNAVQGEPLEPDQTWLELRWWKEDDTPGCIVLEVGQGNKTPDSDDSHTIFLGDRSGINRLIQSLRRARNNTFGKDE